MSVYELPQLVAHDGQSDTLNTELPNGAFVVPAMAVATLGRGSSGAGHEFLDNLFPASEEELGAFKTYPVKLARDEHVILPDQIAFLGNGDIKKGSKLLQDWVHLLIGEDVGHKVED